MQDGTIAKGGDVEETAGSVLDAIERAGYSIITTALDGRIRAFGASAVRLLGYQANDVVGRESVLLIHDQREIQGRAEALSRQLGFPVEADFEALATLARRDGTDEHEWTLVTRKGARIPVVVSVTTLIDATGAATGFLHVAHDVTRGKEVERLKNEFISTVSHELRTPLAAIRGSLGLLEGGLVGGLGEQAAELVRVARMASDRLIRLINDLLDLGKIEAGRLALQISVVETEPLVRETLEQMTGIARRSGVRLVSRVAGKGRLLVDRDRIIQVLTNLIANAVHFSSRGSTVQVSAASGRPGFIRFTVTDHGTGIPPESLARLFRKFEQLDASDARDRTGTGLGLAISKAIIEQHHGDIGVESRIGVGSTFWFEIPLESDEVEQSPSLAVLVLTRNERLSRALGELLAGDGYTLARALSPEAAARLLHLEAPVAILIDVDSVAGAMDFLATLCDGPLIASTLVALSGRARPSDARLDRAAWLESDGERPPASELRRLLPRHLPRALIVDDDPSVRKIVASQLRAHGLACHEAANGAEALRLAHASPPRVIVLDVGMPVMDGYELVGALQGSGMGAIPLVVYSARDLDAQERAALTLGPSRHLVKARASDRDLVRAIDDVLADRSEVLP